MDRHTTSLHTYVHRHPAPRSNPSNLQPCWGTEPALRLTRHPTHPSRWAGPSRSGPGGCASSVRPWTIVRQPWCASSKAKRRRSKRPTRGTGDAPPGARHRRLWSRARPEERQGGQGGDLARPGSPVRPVVASSAWREFGPTDLDPVQPNWTGAASR